MATLNAIKLRSHIGLTFFGTLIDSSVYQSKTLKKKCRGNRLFVNIAYCFVDAT